MNTVKVVKAKIRWLQPTLLCYSTAMMMIVTVPSPLHHFYHLLSNKSPFTMIITCNMQHIQN